MMKKLFFGTVIGGILLLSGCGRDRLSPLGELGQPSLSDSLVYYYGLLEGADYFREALHDSVMLTTRSRERYIKGLKDGLRAVEEVNDTYNRGLEKGVKLALALYEFERIYGITVNKDLLYQSISYALDGDSLLNEASVYSDFRSVLDRLDLKKHAEMEKEMHLSLRAEAQRLGMKKLSDNLFVTDANKGSGALIRRGDMITATLNYILESGRNLEMPSTQQLMVGGPEMAPVMIEVFTRMRSGGSAQYATTAGALFGNRVSQLNLLPSDVILMSVEINNVENPDSTGKRALIAI